MNKFFNPMYHNRYISPPTYYKQPNPQLLNSDVTISKETPPLNAENAIKGGSDNSANSSKKGNPVFEFKNIKLYSDDILILLLIFFLYKENINDTLLFVALISLLF